MNEQAMALRKAALELSTKMIASLLTDDQDDLVQCIRGGGQLLLEVGPLPDCQRIAVVMLEREGKRKIVCAMDCA